MSHQPRPGTRIRAMYDLLVTKFRDGHLRVRWGELHRAYCRSIEGKPSVGRFARQSSWNALTKIAVRNGDGTWSIKHEFMRKEMEMPEKKTGQLTVQEETRLVQDEARISNEILALEDAYARLRAQAKENNDRREQLTDELRVIYRNRVGAMPNSQFMILREQVEAHYHDMINYSIRQADDEDPLSK